MSWALSLRGGYLTAPMWEPTGSLNDWEVVLNVKRVSGSNNAVIFSISDYTDGIYINAANTTGQDAISLHVGGKSVSLNNTGFHSYNDYHRIVAKCVSGSISLEVDGVVSNATPRGALYFNTKKFIIGGNKSGLYRIDIDIKDISVFDTNDVSSYREYNADESFHGVTTPNPLRLVNTLDPNGSTDAIGVNMPTDGSAWVDLGGGLTNYTIDLSQGSLSFLGSSLALVKNSVIDLGAGSLSFSGNQLSLVKNSQLNIGDGKLNFYGNDLQITKQSVISLSSGSINFNGHPLALDVTALNNLQIDIGSGNLSFKGEALNLSVTALNNLQIDIGSGSLAFKGGYLDLSVDRFLNIDTGNLSLIGRSIGLSYSGFIRELQPDYTIGYIANTITNGYVVDTVSSGYNVDNDKINYN